MSASEARHLVRILGYFGALQAVRAQPQHNEMPDVDAQRVRLQIEGILASATFTDPEPASRFLRYMVERKLEGRERLRSRNPWSR